MLADNLVIGGMAAFSTVDYPQHLATTLFLQGCPWRCHYCHNPHLIPRHSDQESTTWKKVQEHLEKRRGLLDAVVFSGGEPTTQKALLPALQNTREQGFKNALHTGAPHLNLLKPLLPWLDWVGLDIQAMPAAYEAVTTSRHSGPESWGAIAELQRAEVSFECRMTWHRALHTREEVVSIGEMLSQRGVAQFALQIARPEPMLNPAIGDARVTVDDKRHVRAELDACFEAFEIRE
jgi:anaerobic ribonucleoside-triphosphate reductase activating protein